MGQFRDLLEADLVVVNIQKLDGKAYSVTFSDKSRIYWDNDKNIWLGNPRQIKAIKKYSELLLVNKKDD